MAKNCRVLSFLFALVFVLSHFSVTAFATDVTTEENYNNELDKILSTYYYSADKNTYSTTSNFSVKDPYSVLEPGTQIDKSKLIPTFSTNTESRGELLELCQKIKNGEHLHNLIYDESRLYTIITNDSGNDIAYAVIDTSDFTVVESGELNEYTRKDFRSGNSVKKIIVEDNLDANTAEMVYCIISNFSTGTLLCDGENEYFIPSVESFESMGILKVGEVYSVPDLADMIEDNISTIFPQNVVDEDGNPYVGAGTPSVGGETPSANITNITENTQTNNGNLVFLIVSIIGFVGAVICFAVAYKNFAKRKRQ